MLKTQAYLTVDSFSLDEDVVKEDTSTNGLTQSDIKDHAKADCDNKSRDS